MTDFVGQLKQAVFKIDYALRFALDRILPKNLTIRYIAALSAVATLAILGQIIIQTSLGRQGEDQKSIRALQTQIHDSENLRKAALTLQLISKRTEIRSQTDLIEFLANRLKKNDRTFDFAKQILELQNSPNNEFLESVQKLNSSLENLIQDCQILGNFAVSRSDTRINTVIVDLLTHEATYRAGLWQISRYYERRLGKQISEFKMIELLLLFITLVVLTIEALYVFRPAVEGLYEALRTRSDFLGRMGHEMRNPMNSILGMINLLFETPLTDQQKKYLSILHKSSSGLLDMLNNLLDFSTIEAGSIRIEKIPFDLYKILERSIDLAVFGAHANGIELVLDLEPDVPLMLKGDPSRLQQILLNLLGNAVKFTKQGEVVLRVCLQKRSAEEVHLTFSVIDTGIGIDQQKISQIFNAFVQEDSTVRRQFGGVGLGLAISSELVELSGGTLSVESQKNLGSRFFFTIPLEVTDELSVDQLIALEKLEPFQARVAEPNQKIFSVVERMILHSGGSVTRVERQSDLEENFEQMIESRKRCEIMILDYESSKEALPGFFAKIRKGQAAADSFLFLIKTTASSEDIERLGKYGIRNFIFKPIKPLQLVKAIGEMLVAAQSSGTKASLSNEDLKEKQPSQDTRALQILAVDDSKDNQFLVKAYLSSLPYRLSFADNGRAAVEKFKEARFDVILMDLQMPEMDGYTAVKLIREWEKTEKLRPTPIIAVSAHDHESSSDRFRNSHFSSYLVKPISPTQLRQEIIKNTTHVTGRRPTEPIKIEVDIELADLAPKYLENRRQEVLELEKLLAASNFDMIQTLGHRLKGNAKSYGFEGLGKMGARLEDTARDKDAATVHLLIEEMKNYLESVVL